MALIKKDVCVFKKNENAFTLIELLVAVVVMMIIISFVVPNFSRIVTQNRMASATNEVLSLMHSARLEAMRTRASVVVCPSDNAQSCSGDDWGQSIMFVDKDKNGQLSSGEIIHRIVDTRNDSLVFDNLISGSPVIYFTADGRAEFGGGSDGNSNVFTLCSPSLPDIGYTLQVGTTMGMTGVVREQGESTCQ